MNFSRGGTWHIIPLQYFGVVQKVSEHLELFKHFQKLKWSVKMDVDPLFNFKGHFNNLNNVGFFISDS